MAWNEHDAREIMDSLNPDRRYRLSSRQMGEIMVQNRSKRSASLAAARAKAKSK